MKVLMVAPKICTPWSEGRKKFFRDLCEETSRRWDVVALITIDAGERTELAVATEKYVSSGSWQHLLHIRSGFTAAVRKHQPDLVCHLPFGAFSGFRGIANIWSILFVERRCRRLKIPCCTLMYSLTSDANTRFHRYVLRNTYRNQHGASGRTIRFGVKLPAVDRARQLEQPRAIKNILFMAGMAEETDERLNYVLDVRGLRFLLKAGKRLQAEGFRLVVAVPLLRNSRLKEKLIADRDNNWDSDSIEYCEKLVLPDVYYRSHVFAFPYACEELQFVPTSIVEAMHYSVPTIVPRLDFLAQFYKPNEISLVYEKDCIDSFVEQLRRLDDQAFRSAHSATASEYIEREYNIKNSANDIEEIYRSCREPSRT
jgi:glycosyltransferase involved in cell wall biosynthesis